MANIRNTLENKPPVYKSTRYSYIRISDIKEEYIKRELTDWIFGQTQPLIQGEGRGVPALLDCVFLNDYERFIREKNLPLTADTK